MASVLSVTNRLLPFATPGTPLLQDILHLTALCVLLYFAPQIQHRLQTWRAKNVIREEPEEAAQNDPVDGTREMHPEVHQQAPNPGQNIQDLDDQGNVLNNIENAPGQDFAPNLNDAAEDRQSGFGGEPDTIPPQRNVGAKKAKSLARKDQRRAYNEFMRSQGDAQRAMDAEGAQEREAALAAEKERRRLAEKELDFRKAKEREAKREREEQQRKENARLTDLVLSTVRDELDSRRMCNLFQVAELIGDDVDEEWIETVLRASGMVGKKGDTMTTITEMGWVVRVTVEDMAALYKAAVAADLGDDDGRIPNEALGALLESLLKQQAIQHDNNGG